MGGQSVQEHRKGEYWISTDRARLDLDVIHGFLVESYWAKGIPREVVVRSIENSLCFGIYCGTAQVGFARVVSDFATYAYLGDVFVLDSHRRNGLGKWLMNLHRGTSRSAGSAALDFGDSRCPRAVCAIRLYAAGRA